MATRRLTIPVLLRLQHHTEYRDGHWLWTGATNGASTSKRRGKDYGIIRDDDGKLRGVHVVSFFLHHPELNGQFPKGTSHVHHTCQVPLCWNPDHLAAESPRGNVLASDTIATRNAAKTHCDYGHELSGTNLLWVQKNDRPRPTRECATCKVRRMREASQRRAARREAARALT